MNTNKKPPVPYAARLARESLKFGLRVAGIIGGVVGASLCEATKRVPSAIGAGAEAPSGSFIVDRSEIQSNSLDEAASHGQPLYYDRFSDDREEQGVWAKR